MTSLAAVHTAASQHPDGLTTDALMAACNLPDAELATALHEGFHRQVIASVNDRIIALPITEGSLP